MDIQLRMWVDGQEALIASIKESFNSYNCRENMSEDLVLGLILRVTN